MSSETPRRVISSFKKPAAPKPAAQPNLSALPQTGGDIAAGLAGIPIMKKSTGTGFFPPGTILTDREKKGLTAVGLDPNGPIPVGVAAKIAALQTELEGSVPMPVPMDTPPVKMPPIVNVDDLPPDRKKEIQDAMKDFVRMQAEFAKSPARDQSPRAHVPPPPPRSMSVDRDDIEFINDLSPGSHPSIAPIPAPIPAPTAPAPEMASEMPSAGGTLDQHPKNCPHCNHDLSLQDTTPITEDDKINFVQSILGGVRFRKKMPLFGGRMTLVFRSLTSSETDLAYRQIVVDAQTDLKDRIVNTTDFYWRNLATYRMVMSLESVFSTSGGLIEVPPIEDIELDDDAFQFPNTKLSVVHDQLIKAVLPIAALRSAVGHAFNEFQAICDKLQVMAEDKDFWNAIA